MCDNLNTHPIASLYEAFDADEAHCLAQRWQLYYTPCNGSWLNVAEIELSVLHPQCFDRRLGDPLMLEQELAAWPQQRNFQQAAVVWRFTTPDTRMKLRCLDANPIF